MTAKRNPVPPAALGQHGRRLWKDVVAIYQLRPDERRLLAAACGSLDTMLKLEAALKTQPATVTGSTGQIRPHPLLGELRQERLAFAAMTRQLNLPNDPESLGELAARQARSLQAQRAARARFGG